MNTVANKLICLNLNANWQPVGYKTVKDAIIDLCGSESHGKPSTLALDIDYELNDNGEPILDEPKSMNPIPWSEWINLPIRNWDLTINSPNRTIRVPTVIISVNFNKMPVKQFRGKPSKEATSGVTLPAPMLSFKESIRRWFCAVSLSLRPAPLTIVSTGASVAIF